MKEKYNLLMVKAEKTKDVQTKIELFEQAMQLADENEEYIMSYEAAMELMESLHNNGDYDRFIHIFYYCLDLYDANGDIFYPEPIMWKYKQYIENIDKTPFIEQAGIDELYKDIEERFAKLNFSLRPIYLYKAQSYKRRGEFTLANEAFLKFQEADKDDMNDCEACEANASLDFYLEGDPQKAEEITQQILSGKLTCQSVPHLTYSKIMMKLKGDGKLEEASQMHEKGYDFIKNSKVYLAELAVHLEFLTEVNIQKAVHVFSENLATVEEACDYHGKFKFYLAALKMKKKAKEKNILLYQFPKDIEEVVYAIAQEFDERNENTYYQDHLKELKK